MRRVMTVGLCLVGWSCGEGPETPVDLASTVSPEEAGNRSVEVVSLSFDLGDRDNLPSEVEVDVYVPTNTLGEVPVVVFNHGFGAVTDDYFQSLYHLASHGMAVVAPQWDRGIPVARTHTGLRDDLSTLLDLLQTTALELPAVLDRERLAVVGHSRGGKQALMFALDDDRADAVVVWDPVDGGPAFGSFDEADYPSIAPERMGELDVPTLSLGFGLGAEGPVPCAPAPENYQAIAEDASDRLQTWALLGAGHNDVLDACASGDGGGVCLVCPLGETPQDTRTLAQAATTAFLLAQLDEDDAMAAWLDSARPEELAGQLER